MRFPANALLVSAPSFVFANAAAAHGYLAIFAFTCSISARLRNRPGCVTGAARVASEEVNTRMHHTNGMTLRSIRFPPLLKHLESSARSGFQRVLWSLTPWTSGN